MWTLTLGRRWISVGLRKCLKRRLRKWASSTHPVFTFSRKTDKKSLEGKSCDGQPSPASQHCYPCRFSCRKRERKREACPAWGEQYVKCSKENHFARKCHLFSTSNKVSFLEKEDELPEFQVFNVSAHQCSKSDLVTLKVLSRNFINLKNGKSHSVHYLVLV